MSESKVLVMPEANEIVSRLQKVNSEGVHLTTFFSLIAKEAAGKDLTGSEVAKVFINKIQSFIKSGGYPPFMAASMGLNVPDWIDALVTDKEVAEEAKASFYIEMKVMHSTKI